MLSSLSGDVVMTKRPSTLALLALLALVPAAASAQVHQTNSSSSSKQIINFSVGYFALKGLESRVDDDILLKDIQSAQPLLFEIKDLNSIPVGGEYLLKLTNNLEFGVGLAYSQRTAHTVYANLTHDDQTEI